jgi:hypothetical protein
MGSVYRPPTKWGTAVAKARLWGKVWRESPETQNTVLSRAMRPIIEGIEDLTHGTLPWRVRWQILLTGKIPEDL